MTSPSDSPCAYPPIDPDLIEALRTVRRMKQIALIDMQSPRVEVFRLGLMFYADALAFERLVLQQMRDG